jgi:lipoprotein-releasing system permease protein
VGTKTSVMKQKLIISIAWGLLFARMKQTMIAATGVAFSITMFITLLSFMTGLNDLLDGLILNRTPHIRLYNDIKPNQIQPLQLDSSLSGHYHFISSVKAPNSRQSLYNSGAIMQALQNDERVYGVSPRIATQVFFNAGTVDITGFINGIDAEKEVRLFFFQDYVTEGLTLDLKYVNNSIILGKPLAEKLLVTIGDIVQVTTPKGQKFSLKVVGIFQSGLLDFDKTASYASIATVQKILGKASDFVTDINIKLHDVDMAMPVAKEYAHIFNAEAEDIKTANAQFETGTFIRTLISYAVGITLLVVAGFGIFNILNMMIYEKMDAIAILKATGFSGTDVRRIFLSIAMFIGFAGGFAGLTMGYLLSTLIDQLPFETAALPTIKTYPINYNPLYYAIGGIFSLVTTWFAGLLPAIKASKIDPVIIIRGK